MMTAATTGEVRYLNIAQAAIHHSQHHWHTEQ